MPPTLGWFQANKPSFDCFAAREFANQAYIYVGRARHMKQSRLISHCRHNTLWRRTL